MTGESVPSPARIWKLVEQQHGVVSRAQLLELDMTERAIEHRIAIGRLRRVWRGVYAVGRPGLTRCGRWIAAVLACGTDAVLSHETAAALWEIRRAADSRDIHISVPRHRRGHRAGIVIHRRQVLDPAKVTRERGIPVTTPLQTLVDLGPRIETSELQVAIIEADKRNLTAADEIRVAIEAWPSQPGVGALKRLLDRSTFRMTDSELERRFLDLVSRCGLPLPVTGATVNGFKVDFFWPDLGLVVETDGLRYHRTPAQQARDRRRDQVHAGAGLVPLRFTHAQVRYQAARVQATLIAVTDRLRRGNRLPPDSGGNGSAGDLG